MAKGKGKSGGKGKAKRPVARKAAKAKRPIRRTANVPPKKAPRKPAPPKPVVRPALRRPVKNRPSVARMPAPRPAPHSHKASSLGASIYERELDKTPANYAMLTPLQFLERSASVYPDRLAVVHGPRR